MVDEFKQKMKKYNSREIFYQELKENLERKRDEDLEAVIFLKRKRKYQRDFILIREKLMI